jgi:hypothetical protein
LVYDFKTKYEEEVQEKAKIKQEIEKAKAEKPTR